MIAVVYCKLLGSVNNIWGRRARVRHTQNFFRNFLVSVKAHYILSTGLISSECWSIHTLDIEIFIIFIFILLPPVFWHASPSSYFQLQKPFKYQNVPIFDDMMAIYSASSYSFNFSNYSYFSTFFSPIEIPCLFIVSVTFAVYCPLPLFLPMLYARN